MAEEKVFSSPLDQPRQRLEDWCRRCYHRLSPLAGGEGARRLIDHLVTERLGRRIDQISPDGFVNGLLPAYPRVRAFFARFAPDVAAYLPRTATPGSLERLRMQGTADATQGRALGKRFQLYLCPPERNAPRVDGRPTPSRSTGFPLPRSLHRVYFRAPRSGGRPAAAGKTPWPRSTAPAGPC